jgi:hypothetical protein
MSFNFFILQKKQCQELINNKINNQIADYCQKKYM